MTGVDNEKLYTFPTGKLQLCEDGTVVYKLGDTEGLTRPLVGDIMIRFKNANILSKEEICRIQFNTAFIAGNCISAGKLQLSPEDLRKNKQVPEELRVELHFEPPSQNCHPQVTELEELDNASR